MEVPVNGFPIIEEAQPTLKPSRNGHGGRNQKKTDGRFDALNAFIDTRAEGLSPATQMVWITLWRDARDNVCTTAQSYIAKRLGYSERTVMRAIAQLVDRGLVKVVKRGCQYTGPATYELTIPPSWKK